jgi:hypothetical protein
VTQRGSCAAAEGAVAAAHIESQQFFKLVAVGAFFSQHATFHPNPPPKKRPRLPPRRARTRPATRGSIAGPPTPLRTLIRDRAAGRCFHHVCSEAPSPRDHQRSLIRIVLQRLRRLDLGGPAACSSSSAMACHFTGPICDRVQQHNDA